MDDVPLLRVEVLDDERTVEVLLLELLEFDVLELDLTVVLPLLRVELDDDPAVELLLREVPVVERASDPLLLLVVPELDRTAELSLSLFVVPELFRVVLELLLTVSDLFDVFPELLFVVPELDRAVEVPLLLFSPEDERTVELLLLEEAEVPLARVVVPDDDFTVVLLLLPLASGR